MKKNRKNISNDQEYELVYSTDPIKGKNSTDSYCPACSRNLTNCVCKKGALISTDNLKPAVRIERKGRAGKSVTVVTKLPAHATFVKELLGYLKRSIGCGGTYYIEGDQGVIELQGERQDQTLQLIAKYK